MITLDTVRIFYFLFGGLTIVGGLIGYLKAKSRASLIAGLVSGLLLDLAGVLLAIHRDRPIIGLVVGTVVTLLLLGRFLPAFLKTKKAMPAGMITVLGLISLVLSIAALAKL